MSSTDQGSESRGGDTPGSTPTAERRCLSCGGPMVGRNRKAKFCGRDCQVQHLRTVGPTASGNDPMTPGKTITVQLDELDQERLRQVCHEVVVSPRTWCTLLVRQRLAELRPLPPVVSS